jgi:hypothetical protein
MFLLPLQIFFAVKAWRRGWRWRALIPFGATMALAVVAVVVAALYAHGDHVRMEDAKDIAGIVGTAWGAVVTGWLARMAKRPVRPTAGTNPPPSALAQRLVPESIQRLKTQ